MYPVLRLAWQLWQHRKDPPIGLCDLHVSRHMCLPVDIDPWLELNNGRTLTLYDLGRMSAGLRIGLAPVLRARRLGLAVAGVSVRYRKRVTVFQKIEMHTRIVGWDARFAYVLQAMWVEGTCTSQALVRVAVTSGGRAVPPADAVAAAGWSGPPPDLPEWVAAWIAAEKTRTWPPEVPEGHVPPGS